MEQALARYLRWQRSVNHSPRTLRYHKQTIGYFIDWLREQGHSAKLADLHVDDVRGWIAAQQDRGLSPHTILSRIRSIKALTAWLVAEEFIDKDPLRRLKAPKVDDVAKPTLSIKEVDKLLASCDRKKLTGARDFAIMLLLFSTGLRASELAGLQVEDVNWEQGVIVVRRGKGGKFRVLPLGQKVDKAIAKYLRHPQRPESEDGPLFLTAEGQPLSYNGLRLMLYRRGRKAGIHANPHKFRHSAAIQYLRAGGRVETLQRLLGHSTIEMSLHYARVVADDVSAGHETADPTLALKTKG